MQAPLVSSSTTTQARVQDNNNNNNNNSSQETKQLDLVRALTAQVVDAIRDGRRATTKTASMDLPRDVDAILKSSGLGELTTAAAAAAAKNEDEHTLTATVSANDAVCLLTHAVRSADACTLTTRPSDRVVLANTTTTAENIADDACTKMLQCAHRIITSGTISTQPCTQVATAWKWRALLAGDLVEAAWSHKKTDSTEDVDSIARAWHGR